MSKKMIEEFFNISESQPYLFPKLFTVHSNSLYNTFVPTKNILQGWGSPCSKICLCKNVVFQNGFSFYIADALPSTFLGLFYVKAQVFFKVIVV